MATGAHLALADWAALALSREAKIHGWAVVKAMEPGGDVGRVWSCSRARVYRALDTLADAGLLEVVAIEPGRRGPARRAVSATPAGRAAVQGWLAIPAAHVRDLRSELLLKLLFVSRAGGDPSALLAAQRTVLESIEGALGERERDAQGFERILVRWRLEACRGGLRFLESFAERRPGRGTSAT